MQDDVNFVRAIDYVIIGHDDAALVDNEARPQRCRPARRIFPAILTIEELFEKLLEGRARRQLRPLLRRPLALDRLAGRDIDHRRQELGRQIGKAFRRRTAKRRPGAQHQRHRHKGGKKADHDKLLSRPDAGSGHAAIADVWKVGLGFKPSNHLFFSCKDPAGTMPRTQSVVFCAGTRPASYKVI